MKRRLVLIALAGLAAPALAEPQAPELKPPVPAPDIRSPLPPFPDTRPDVDWDRLLAGCTERKQVSKESREAEVTTAHVRRSYDGAGRVTRIEEIEYGKLSTGTDYTYDGKGRLTRSFLRHLAVGSIEPYTVAYDYGYDDAGRVVRMVKHEVDGTKELPAEETVFGYDAVGRLATSTSGGAVTHLLRSKTGALLGLTVDQADGKKNALYQGTEDGAGRLVRLVTPPDLEETVVYDAGGRERQRTTTRAGTKETLTVTRDVNGRVVKVEGVTEAPDGKGQELRAARYDDKGRMVALSVSSSRHSGEHAFNQAAETSFTWDDAGRLVGEKEKFGGSDGMHGFNLEAETSYRYDGKGRLVQMVSHAAGYPPLDRTITTTYSY
jgi:hypothetical protein